MIWLRKALRYQKATFCCSAMKENLWIKNYPQQCILNEKKLLPNNTSFHRIKIDYQPVPRLFVAVLNVKMIEVAYLLNDG